MSKHTSTFLAREPVEVLVNEHVIVEAVLSCECSVTYQADKRLDTYNNMVNSQCTTTTTTITTVLSCECSVTYQADKRLDTYNSIAGVLLQ